MKTAVSLGLIASAWAADTSGKILGTVKDPAGNVVPQASVTLTNKATGVKQATHADGQGVFAFPVVPVGAYELNVTIENFRPYKRTDVVVDLGSALQLEIALELAGVTESVTVTEDAAQVETSDTKLGQVIGNRQVTALPLNGRSYTDLLAIQGGVTPITTSGAGNSTSGGGFGTVPVGGNGNTGQFSINGQRESANGFYLNGASVQETIGQQAGIIPNLDSIAEFRILTSNADAEYGGYSGGIVNVITKAGGNDFHGSAFEFLRNTDLDSRGFFSPERSTFQQNQFGGTLGGPIRKNKVFFFGDYQGQRTIQGLETGLVQVPSLANRAGNFADAAGTLTGRVNGDYLAQTLTDRLGYAVNTGEPFYTPNCTSTARCVFPNAIIPQRAFSAPATRLLQYIPAPNTGSGLFSSGAEKNRLNDGKGALRVDFNSEKRGALYFYYFAETYNQNNPYPSGFGGATVPGFNALSNGLTQLTVLSHTMSFGPTAVNEARVSFTRLNNQLGIPQGGVGVSLADQGFSTGPTGIQPGFPKYVGVETLYFNTFTIGANPFSLSQVNNTYEASDNFSKVRGNHTLKFGGQYTRYKVKQLPNLVANGTFSFFGSGAQSTGNGFADFLLGLPDNYSQQSSPAFYELSVNAGIFVEDTWRFRPNLTINYGLRWDYIRPWSEDHNQISTLIYGENSVLFPGAPSGYVLPGDPGVPSTIAPTPLNDFSPRLGIAYSPGWSSALLNKLTGGPGKTSIRVGAGRFFTAIEGLTVAYPTGNPPYGLTYVSPEPPQFAQPFVGALTGTQYVQQFPVNVPPYSVSPGNPFTTDWSRYVPINGAISYFYKNRTPYAMTANVTIERQIGNSYLASVSYVGSLGRHLLTSLGANPGVPSLCLGLSEPQDVAPGTRACGPFGENGVYTRASGNVVNGTRAPFNNDIGSDGYFANMGNSNYNALQLTLKRTKGGLTLLASYSYSKSLDWSSNLQEQVNPYNYRQDYGPSAFDIKHNLVFSYNYELPFAKLFLAKSRLVEGWAISGIARFATGLPVTFSSFGDNALMNVQNNGINGIGIDLPDVVKGDLQINRDPRNGKPYFNTSLFSPNALGTPGNAARRMFYGPGMDNFDVALHKVTKFGESRALELRFETFNSFNHAQFFGANAVDGNINSSTFGYVTHAASPRISQVAAKFTF
ncbi:MAG: carboxypeptidase regulatory-like domain-containing protein [Bryobacterales bacterium]|nr:carboxypeptidase regulatory-like domain-containing protein [Bryobacterales bacterium]MBV9401817.1 carboxypeptidase regulatory-like domain-containing protein [Bryobacterales bacterium]